MHLHIHVHINIHDREQMLGREARVYSEERNWEGEELETQGWVEKLHPSDSALAPLVLSLCFSPVTGNSPCCVRQHVGVGG